jgi:hypothetical protein
MVNCVVYKRRRGVRVCRTSTVSDWSGLEWFCSRISDPARGLTNVMEAEGSVRVVFPVQTHHWSWNPLTVGRIAWRAVIATIAMLFGKGPQCITIEEFLATCRTGDLLLMESDGLFSWMQTWWTGSTASHVALVVVDENEDVFLLESTYSETGVPNIVTGQPKSGPMLVSAGLRIHHYLTRIGFAMRYRRMWVAEEAPDMPKKTDNVSSRCRGNWTRLAFQMAREKANVPFNSNVFDLMDGSVPTIRLFADMLIPSFIMAKHGKGEFCAELVAEFYQRAGAMFPLRPPNRFAPKDFTEHGYNLPMDRAFGFYPAQWVFFDGS